MSTSPSNKNWLYFAFGAVATTLIGAITFTLLNSGKSAQSQSAGTWKVEASSVPSGPPSVTIIISSEGKITALNPTNEKEAIEIGKITKVSDVTTLPETAKVQSNLFANQATKARQSEAKTYVGALNRSQQAYFLEKNKWAKTIQESEIGIKAETENYRYNIQNIDSIKTVDIKNYPGITIQTALAKKEGLKSYLGVIYLSKTVAGGETSSLSVVCESNEPTTKEAGLPKFDGKAMQCPDGYKSMN